MGHVHVCGFSRSSWTFSKKYKLAGLKVVNGSLKSKPLLVAAVVIQSLLILHAKTPSSFEVQFSYETVISILLQVKDILWYPVRLTAQNNLPFNPCQTRLL